MLRLALTALCLALQLLPSNAAAEVLKTHGNRLFVPVTVNGSRVEALLDTAAEMTFIDARLAQQLKLQPEGSQTAKGSGGHTEVQFAKGITIEAAGVTLSNLTVA